MSEKTTLQALVAQEDVQITDTAMVLPLGLTREQWIGLAERVTNVGHGFWWWIGDLAAYAYRTFDTPLRAVEELAAATGTGASTSSWCGTRRSAIRCRSG